MWASKTTFWEKDHQTPGHLEKRPPFAKTSTVGLECIMTSKIINQSPKSRLRQELQGSVAQKQPVQTLYGFSNQIVPRACFPDGIRVSNLPLGNNLIDKPVQSLYGLVLQSRPHRFNRLTYYRSKKKTQKLEYCGMSEPRRDRTGSHPVAKINPNPCVHHEYSIDYFIDF